MQSLLSAAAREVFSCQQETLHGFCRPGEGVWLSASEGHLVGAEKTVWRSGLCEWCRGCMPMHGVVSVLGRGEVKAGFPRLGIQPAVLHHCAWSLVMQVPLWGSLGGPLCQWPCYHRWITRGMCQEALDLKRSKWGEKNESKCRKDEDHDLSYGPGSLAEVRWVSMCCLSHPSGQQQHLLRRLQVLSAQEMQWAQALDKGPWLQMYTVPGNCTPLRWQTTEGSPSQTWQARGSSFLLLPRRHALSSWWLWTFNHNTCVNSLEEVQGAATSSLFPPPLFQHMAACTALVCRGQCSMPVRHSHWQSQTSNVCSEMTGQWSDRSVMSSCKTLSPPDPMSYLHGLALRIWTSFWRREGSAGMDM